MANLGNIAKREDRTIKFGPAADLGAGYELLSYRIGFRASDEGADLASVTFGPAEYQATGDHADYWLIPLPEESTTLLTKPYCQVGVFTTEEGAEQLVNGSEDYVTIVDRPGKPT